MCVCCSAHILLVQTGSLTSRGIATGVKVREVELSQ